MAYNTTTSTNNITAQPSILVNPTGNPPDTLASFNVQTTTSSTTLREFIVDIGMTTGVGGNYNGADKVALYVGSVVLGTSQQDGWAINALQTVDAGVTQGTYQTIEVDVNNHSGINCSLSGAGTTYQQFGIGVSGDNAFQNSAGFWVSGGQKWSAGIFLQGGGGGAQDFGLLITDNSTSAIQIDGVHTYGIDLAGGVSTYDIRLNNGNTSGICASGASGSGVFNVAEVSGTGLSIGDVGLTFTQIRSNLIPSSDNTYLCGNSGSRWSAVWAATGTIQTSDPSMKTDIADLGAMLPVIMSLKPKSYKWKVGGNDVIDVAEEQTVHDEALREWTEESLEYRGGVPVVVQKKRSRYEALYDEVHAVDDTGRHLYINVPARPEKKDEEGRIITPASPAKVIPRTHKVPRMVTKTVQAKKTVERAGKRTHLGFLATDIRDAFSPEASGLPDFAGYVKDGDTHALRPDQVLPAVVKAFQEYVIATDAKIADLQAKIGGAA